jgi:hypothetical protein
MIRKMSEKLPELEYFIKGTNPKLLIHSGTHGDEFEVVDFVRKAVEKYENILPDFIFVPIVSPSAIKNKTRLNKNGHDLNRIFFSDSTEIEVTENIKILDGFDFDLVVSFHEDPEFDEYYIYDEGQSDLISSKVLKHIEKLNSLNVKLLNGVDDPSDPHLGHEFKNGYAKFDHPEGREADGTATLWIYSEKRAKGILVPEIPGRVSLQKRN